MMASRNTRHVRRAILFVVLTLGFASLTSMTLAQARRGARPPAHGKRPRVDAGTAAGTGDGDASVLPMTGRPEDAPAARGDAGTKGPGGHGDSEAVEARTLDGGAHVFRFGEMEIEGRLKSPQLVYFLRRVRAEFAAGDMGHRSFMREMSDTRSDPSF